MNVSERLTHGFFYIFSGRVGGGILTILITPIIVRVLGSGGYGDYAFAMAIYSALRTVGGAGVYEGARKYIAEYADPTQQAGVFEYYLKISVVSGIVVSLGLLGFTYFAVGTILLEYRLRNYLYIVALMVFMHGFYHLVRSALMGYQLEEYSEPLYVLNRFFFLIIGIPLAAIGFHVAGALIGWALSSTLVVLLGWLALLRYTSVGMSSLQGLFPQSITIFQSRMFRYGLLNVVFVLLTKSLYVTDIVLLQPFEGSEQVGFYNAALVVAEFLWFIPLALQIVVLHSASRLWAENRANEITEMAATITRYTLLLTGTSAVILAIVGDVFLPLYFGSAFIVAYLPMVLLLPGVVSFAVARPIYGIGQGHGNMRALIYGTGGAALLNLVLNLILIPRYGVYGAAVATSIGYGSMLFFHVWAARKLGFYPLQNVGLLRIVITCILPVPFLWYINSVLPVEVLSLIVIPVLGGIIFVLIALGTKAITTTEVRNGLRLFRQKVPMV